MESCRIGLISSSATWGLGSLIESRWQAIAVIASVALCVGCATESALAPGDTPGSEGLVRHAADVLFKSVAYTRMSSREVAGWCWNDKATGRLAYVTQTHVGEYEGVGVSVPNDRGGARSASCSWHTHPWGSHVAPGPSKQDLQNSMLPWVRGMAHFVLDQHGIWQYANGRVIEMCPWNSTGTNVDPTRCHSGFQTPTLTHWRVERFYGRRD
jgi:hypothetical protein